MLACINLQFGKVNYNENSLLFKLFQSKIFEIIKQLYTKLAFKAFETSPHKLTG